MARIPRWKRWWYLLVSHKVLSPLCSLLLLALGFFIYEKAALELNKRAFIGARHTIDIVYADIVKDVGQLNNSLTINECSRSHLELSDGPLSCSVNTEFVYGVADKNESDKLMSKIKASVAKHAASFKPTAPPKSEISVSPSVHDVSDSEVGYYSAAGLFCTIKYVFDTPEDLDIRLQNSNAMPFAVNVSCSSKARDVFYPISN